MRALTRHLAMSIEPLNDDDLVDYEEDDAVEESKLQDEVKK